MGQCLDTKEKYDPYRCPADATSKCVFGRPPAACPAWVGHENGLCSDWVYGACYDSEKKGFSQCLDTKEKYDPYSCPADASSKCMFQPAPLKTEAGAAVSAIAGAAVAGTTCPSWVGHEHGLCSDWVYGACYDPAKNSFSQCLDYQDKYDPYNCPADASSKCVFGPRQALSFLV